MQRVLGPDRPVLEEHGLDDGKALLVDKLQLDLVDGLLARTVWHLDPNIERTYNLQFI